MDKISQSEISLYSSNFKLSDAKKKNFDFVLDLVYIITSSTTLVLDIFMGKFDYGHF